MTIEYRKTMWAEMSPDVYGGETCDQMHPRWIGFAEGDRDSDYSDRIEFDAKNFPAGTKVIVLEPECPKCHQVSSLCQSDETCDFDWNRWILERYS